MPMSATTFKKTVKITNLSKTIKTHVIQLAITLAETVLMESVASFLFLSYPWVSTYITRKQVRCVS